MKKILVVFGTRPEAIKLAPVIKELKKQKWAKVSICVTAQHREMLDQVLDYFRIKPDYDLNIMKKQQDLFSITSDILLKINSIISECDPDLIMVQGDTTTVFVTALAAFYMNVRVAHVEAGLRTRIKNLPFPEEMNRMLTSCIASYHFAPTPDARNNLLTDGIDDDTIFVTGNTVIDALFITIKKLKSDRKKADNIVQQLNGIPFTEKKIILVTGHRRESFGIGFRNICHAIKEIAVKRPDCAIIYPVHLNPNVRKPVFEILNSVQNIFLMEPLDYEPFIYLMSKSYLILTDSGGVQEEAPSLGKPVLVMRNETERQEGIRAGVSLLVGTDKDSIVAGVVSLLDNKDEYEKISSRENPYGDGTAARKIVSILHTELYK